jgi:hypothetical protein
MRKLLLIVIAIVSPFLVGCHVEKPFPEIQIREDIKGFQETGKVSFVQYGYKGVFRIKLIDNIQKTDSERISQEILESCKCKLVKPAYPELKNPDTEHGLIYVRDATDEEMLKLSKDERIKFIAQHQPDH